LIAPAGAQGCVQLVMKDARTPGDPPKRDYLRLSA
jgi:hypothetical protein